MVNDIFYNQIAKYNPNSEIKIKNAMKEVLQDIILVGISKSDFFKHCSFYGGTALRLFKGLPRFSEDLDFTLLEEKDDFVLLNYVKYIENELDSLGIEYKVNYKDKIINTSVDSIYFDFNLKYLFSISYVEYEEKIINNEVLSIKIEVEKQCFSGGVTELKLLTYPSFAQIRLFNSETLFASKLLAILNRHWKNRVKGRDYYDYLFYISLGVKINMEYLENGLKKFGYLNVNDKLTIERLKEELINKFNNVDFDSALMDVKTFINDNDRFIDSFRKDIFISTVDLIIAY